ncbi:MAG: T9SS type A sorting domain-containing protein, partial [Flavobacteriales bacterium]|nr:T9SS type A sorting domain-containing protein [Flavobacteriales bacterium]
LRIIDLLGKEVLHSRYAESIDVSSLNNGLYLLEIISSDKRYSQKIQIDR